MYRSIEINIMNIFEQLPSYAGKYTVKLERPFTTEELVGIERATTVASEFGISVCFFMKNGAQKYIPLSTESTAGVGETLDMGRASLMVLTKNGNNDILRVNY